VSLTSSLLLLLLLLLLPVGLPVHSPLPSSSSSSLQWNTKTRRDVEPHESEPAAVTYHGGYGGVRALAVPGYVTTPLLLVLLLLTN